MCWTVYYEKQYILANEIDYKTKIKFGTKELEGGRISTKNKNPNRLSSRETFY